MEDGRASVGVMRLVTVPPALKDAVGDIDDMQILTWDLRADPPMAEEIEVVVLPPFRAPWITRLGELPHLRAIQLSSAGHEHALRFVPSGVTLAKAVGVHDSATAEMALALMLAAQRDIPDFVNAQRRGQWEPPKERRSLADSTVLIVGYGGIGRALGRRLRACEADVLAVAAHERAGDDFVQKVCDPSELPKLLPRADIVCLSAPLTPATLGLLNAAHLRLLPDDALVVNVARGAIVDTDALIAECAAGRLRAALDVVDPEPLPPEHPLWSTPAVLISPHTAGSTSAFVPRMARFVRSQLTAYRDTGSLPHVVATG